MRDKTATHACTHWQTLSISSSRQAVNSLCETITILGGDCSILEHPLHAWRYRRTIISFITLLQTCGVTYLTTIFLWALYHVKPFYAAAIWSYLTKLISPKVHFCKWVLKIRLRLTVDAFDLIFSANNTIPLYVLSICIKYIKQQQK